LPTAKEPFLYTLTLVYREETWTIALQMETS